MHQGFVLCCFYVGLYLYTIQIYSGITSGRVLDGELLYTKILEVNLFAFAYRLFHEYFSPIDMALHDTQPFSALYTLIW